MALVLFFFTVFHLNVLYLVLTGGPQLDTYREAENYLVTNYGILSFNLIQQLEFNVLSNKSESYDVKISVKFIKLLQLWDFPLNIAL